MPPKGDLQKNRTSGQTTLDGQISSNNNNKKVVSFSNVVTRSTASEKEAAFKEEIREQVKQIRQEKVEMEIMKVEVNAKMTDIVERLDRLERKFLEWEERAVRIAADSSTCSPTMDGASGSMWSISMSERDMVRMKKLLAEKDKCDRQNNIVIKGLRANVENVKELVQDFINSKLKLKIEVDSVWGNKNVIIAKIKGEGKNEIMSNKSKLTGSNVFIENDLSFEDRKRQGTIRNWVKEKKEEGWAVKAGFNRILFRGVWRKWEEKVEIENEMIDLRQKEIEKNNNSDKSNEQVRKDFVNNEENFV